MLLRAQVWMDTFPASSLWLAPMIKPGCQFPLRRSMSARLEAQHLWLLLKGWVPKTPFWSQHALHSQIPQDYRKQSSSFHMKAEAPSHGYTHRPSTENTWTEQLLKGRLSQLSKASQKRKVQDQVALWGNSTMHLKRELRVYQPLLKSPRKYKRREHFLTYFVRSALHWYQSLISTLGEKKITGQRLWWT